MNVSKKPILNLEQAIKQYGLTIVGAKGTGKTNALMVILHNIDAIPCVVDFATVHAFNLGSKFTVKFLNEKYLLRKPRINIDKPIIIDISQTTKPQASEIIRELIKNEYYSRVHEVIDNFKNGMEKRQLNREWLVFCLEEAQTTIGKYLKSDSDLATAMAVGRNYKVGFIFVTQRLSELNTALSERTAYLIGKVVGDNNIRKLSRLLGIPRKKLKFVETLPRGQFLFYNGERIERLEFPKFNGSRASEIKRTIYKKKPKNKNLWQKLKDSFKSEQQEDSEESNIYDLSEKDSDADIEDDALIGEDLFGEDW